MFLSGWAFLPVGPRAHGLSQPCAHGCPETKTPPRVHGGLGHHAHGVSREFHAIPCARGSKTTCARGVQRVTNYPRAARGSKTSCARGIQEVSVETHRDTSAKHTIQGKYSGRCGRAGVYVLKRSHTTFIHDDPS